MVYVSKHNGGEWGPTCERVREESHFMPGARGVWVRVDRPLEQAPAALSASGGFSDPSLCCCCCLLVCLLDGSKEGLKQS